MHKKFHLICHLSHRAKARVDCTGRRRHPQDMADVDEKSHTHLCTKIGCLGYPLPKGTACRMCCLCGLASLDGTNPSCMYGASFCRLFDGACEHHMCNFDSCASSTVGARPIGQCPYVEDNLRTKRDVQSTCSPAVQSSKCCNFRTALTCGNVASNVFGIREHFAAIELYVRRRRHRVSRVS